jgi:hypothetical protein
MWGSHTKKATSGIARCRTWTKAPRVEKGWIRDEFTSTLHTNLVTEHRAMTPAITGAVNEHTNPIDMQGV